MLRTLRQGPEGIANALRVSLKDVLFKVVDLFAHVVDDLQLDWFYVIMLAQDVGLAHADTFHTSHPSGIQRR